MILIFVSRAQKKERLQAERDLKKLNFKYNLELLDQIKSEEDSRLASKKQNGPLTYQDYKNRVADNQSYNEAPKEPKQAKVRTVKSPKVAENEQAKNIKIQDFSPKKSQKSENNCIRSPGDVSQGTKNGRRNLSEIQSVISARHAKWVPKKRERYRITKQEYIAVEKEKIYEKEVNGVVKVYRKRVIPKKWIKHFQSNPGHFADNVTLKYASDDSMKSKSKISDIPAANNKIPEDYGFSPSQNDQEPDFDDNGSLLGKWTLRSHAGGVGSGTRGMIARREFGGGEKRSVSSQRSVGGRSNRRRRKKPKRKGTLDRQRRGSLMIGRKRPYSAQKALKRRKMRGIKLHNPRKVVDGRASATGQRKQFDNVGLRTKLEPLRRIDMFSTPVKLKALKYNPKLEKKAVDKIEFDPNEGSSAGSRGKVRNLDSRMNQRRLGDPVNHKIASLAKPEKQKKALRKTPKMVKKSQRSGPLNSRRHKLPELGSGPAIFAPKMSNNFNKRPLKYNGLAKQARLTRSEQRMPNLVSLQPKTGIVKKPRPKPRQPARGLNLKKPSKVKPATFYTQQIDQKLADKREAQRSKVNVRPHPKRESSNKRLNNGLKTSFRNRGKPIKPKKPAFQSLANLKPIQRKLSPVVQPEKPSPRKKKPESGVRVVRPNITGKRFSEPKVVGKSAKPVRQGRSAAPEKKIEPVKVIFRKKPQTSVKRKRPNFSQSRSKSRQHARPKPRFQPNSSTSLAKRPRKVVSRSQSRLKRRPNLGLKQSPRELNAQVVVSGGRPRRQNRNMEREQNPQSQRKRRQPSPQKRPNPVQKKPKKQVAINAPDPKPSQRPKKQSRKNNRSQSRSRSKNKSRSRSRKSKRESSKKSKRDQRTPSEKSKKSQKQKIPTQPFFVADNENDQLVTRPSDLNHPNTNSDRETQPAEPIAYQPNVRRDDPLNYIPVFNGGRRNDISTNNMTFYSNLGITGTRRFQGTNQSKDFEKMPSKILDGLEDDNKSPAKQSTVQNIPTYKLVQEEDEDEYASEEEDLEVVRMGSYQPVYKKDELPRRKFPTVTIDEDAKKRALKPLKKRMRKKKGGRGQSRSKSRKRNQVSNQMVPGGGGKSARSKVKKKKPGKRAMPSYRGKSYK